MIEQNTNYAYKLKYMENPTFDKVRELSTKFYRELPQALQDELFEALNRGIDIMDSEPQMTAYLFAFGKMHQAKLEYAFSKLPNEFLEQPEINIIDYGCGQALGTMCYADFLRNKGCTQKVKTITLIEPSEICMKRAALHASVFFSDSEIKIVNKTFDELDENDIYYKENVPTLHIFSNVLDILDFNLERLAELIKGQVKSYSQFICVGPYFNYSDKDERMESLCSILNGKDYYNMIFDKHKFFTYKDWTAHLLCFSFEKVSGSFSTGYTSDELSQSYYVNRALPQRFNMPYAHFSKDGMRLFEFKNDKATHFEIPIGVSVICDKAFYNCVSLESVSIPNTVIAIGNLAFEGCTKLKEIVIPHSVKYIGDNPFACQLSMNSHIPVLKSNSNRFVVEHDMLIDLNERRLVCYFGHNKKVIIPDIIYSIGNYAFHCCDFIEQVIIPNSVKFIGKYAFHCCYLQGQFFIPESVTKIGEGAFSFCSFQSVVIPKSLEYIEGNPFWCNGSSFVIKSNSDRFVIIDNLLVDKTKKKIVTYFGDDNIVIVPDGIVSIGESAFFGCESIEQIIIPPSVTRIGSGAFANCENMRKINIPNGVTTIENETFEFCYELRQLLLPDTISSIGDFAFAWSSLIQINLPKAIDSIGWKVFHDCHSLEQIIIPKGTMEKFDQLLKESQSLDAELIEQ